MRKLVLPGASFTHLAYASAQGLLSIEYDRGATYRLWDLAEGRSEVIDWLQGRVVWVAFQPGGVCFLRSQGFWPDGERLPPAVHKGTTDRHPIFNSNEPDWRPVAFGPGGAVLYWEQLLGTSSARFHLRAGAGQVNQVYQAASQASSAADFSPDGRLVAMSGGDRLVIVWGLAQGREVLRIEARQPVKCVAFAAGDRLAIAQGKSILFWDVATDQMLRKSSTSRIPLRGLAASPERRLIAAGVGRVVSVWDASGAEVASYDWELGTVTGVAFSPDGATAAASGKGVIVIWDLD
jgi:WD40 repeat protein